MLAALMIMGATAGAVPGGPAACAAIEADAARLACYDGIYRNVTAVPDAPGNDAASRSAGPGAGALPAVANAAAGSTGAAGIPSAPNPVADFGLTEQQKAREESDAKPQPQELKDIVREVKKIAVDRWAFYLENGQVWAQAESTTRQPFKAGDWIRIREAAMSSYFASGPNTGGSVRVRRAL